jgi:hypothetical protein
LLGAVRGPIILITVGVLFALNNFTQYRFDQTWPIILIVFGLLTLLRRGTYRARPDQPQPWAPQANYAGTFRQSQYPGTVSAPPPPPPDAGPVKGGFGTSAPPRAENTSPSPEPPAGGNV